MDSWIHGWFLMLDCDDLKPENDPAKCFSKHHVAFFKKKTSRIYNDFLQELLIFKMTTTIDFKI